MEIYDKEEIKLIEEFRKKKAEEEVFKKARVKYYEDFRNALASFIASGGAVRTAYDDYGDCQNFIDCSFDEAEKEIILFLTD